MSPSEHAGTAHELAERWFAASVDAPRPVTAGATNATFELEVSSGDRFYLRRYRRPGRDAVLREHALIQHVRSRGIPAPQPLERDGVTVFEAADGAAWAVFEAASGSQLAHAGLSSAHVERAGQLLARLHLATATASLGGYARRVLAWDGPAWLARLERIRAAILQLPQSDETDRWARERVERQRQWLANTACAHAYRPAAPDQILHGDYQLSNLFFTGLDVTGVIDWETSMCLPRAYELVRTCFFLCEMRPDLCAALVSGYRAVTPLSASELDDGAAAWGVFADHHVWPLEETYLHHNRAAARFIWHRPFRPFAQEWRACGVGSVAAP
jgi:homoserine kinase type II